MPRNQRNSKRRAEKAIKKPRPPGKRLKDIKVANVGLRRSERRTSNAFASNRITANRLTLPLTFFDQGIRSETVSRKKEDVVVVRERNRHILNEDLLALIPPANTKVQSGEVVGPPTRRITRSFNNRFNNISSYYLTCLSNQATCSESTEDTVVPSKSDIQGDSTSNQLEEIHEESEGNPTVEIDTLEKTNASTFNVTLSDKIRSVNYKFCHDVFGQIRIRLKGAKRTCILRLKQSIEKIDDILDGKREPVSPPKMSTKRLSEDDYDVRTSVSLVPQSQWVYSTPDKQNIKKFVFDEGSDKIHPAVIRTSKKSKVLYDIKNEVMQQINLNKFKSGQNIPIDRRYLKTICENTIATEEMVIPKPAKKQRLDDGSEKENVFSFVAPAKKATDFVFQPQATSSKDEFNVFLSGASEESIDIHKEIERGTETVMDLSFEAVESVTETRRKDVTVDLEEKYENFDFRQCRSALPKDCFFFTEDPYEKAPKDYRHQLLLATQRPAKTNRKIQKRHMLKAKSLSFENTPPGAKVAIIEPKRLEMARKMEEDCLDEFEKEFPSLVNTTSNTLNVLDIPHTITSGALDLDTTNVTTTTDVEMEDQFNIQTFNENLQNTFKFYPRRNFDPE